MVCLKKESDIFLHSVIQVRNFLDLAKPQKIISMIHIFTLFHKNIYHALSTNVVFWLSLPNCKFWQITGIMSFNYYNSKSLPWCSVEIFSVYNFFQQSKFSFAPHKTLLQLLNNKSILSTSADNLKIFESLFHLEQDSRKILNCDNGLCLQTLLTQYFASLP